MRQFWCCVTLCLCFVNLWAQEKNDEFCFQPVSAKMKEGKKKNGHAQADMLLSPQCHWISEHIAKEFSFFQNQGRIPKDKISILANEKSLAHLFLVKFSIKKNKVSVSHKISHDWLLVRVDAIQSAMQWICQLYALPDMELIVSIHDAVDAQLEVPLFVMAKHRNQHTQILIPDFEALQSAWQVLAGSDITRDVICPWEMRKNRMIWRGSTAQHGKRGFPVSLNPAEEHCLSRVKLCALSARFPGWINAKFTKYTRGTESLQIFRGDFISYEEQLEYKYQMHIDGNTCPYSASGWKWFSGSVVFKEDSDHIQWYYHGLEPWKHYIPVKEGLGDLMEKLHWARDHDEEARRIAHNARTFALERISEDMNLLYFYGVLMAYHKLLQ